jgi:hypothetical protein
MPSPLPIRGWRRRSEASSPDGSTWLSVDVIDGRYGWQSRCRELAFGDEIGIV